MPTIRTRVAPVCIRGARSRGDTSLATAPLRHENKKFPDLATGWVKTPCRPLCCGSCTAPGREITTASYKHLACKGFGGMNQGHVGGPLQSDYYSKHYESLDEIVDSYRHVVVGAAGLSHQLLHLFQFGFKCQ